VPSAPRTARERGRAELTREILDIARRHLADQGAAALSLRAIARELGMVSSAVYRYVPSRDDLLTALIVEAYATVGQAAEDADDAAPQQDPLARYLAIAHATRDWAVAHPHEWALIFGSPVPGYRAPVDTIDPAARIPLRLLQILADSPRRRRRTRDLPESVAADLRSLAEQTGSPLDDELLLRAVAAWVQLVGLVSFELFGHLNNVIHSYREHFDAQIRGTAADLGLVPRPTRAT
jgi:AcrR family transcriptional regulator